MSKYYYAVEYKSGTSTTAGQPNEKTGRYSKAVDCACFKSESERDTWVGKGKHTPAMRGNCREAVTKKELRELHLGMSIADYNEFVENLNWTADEEIA